MTIRNAALLALVFTAPLAHAGETTYKWPTGPMQRRASTTGGETAAQKAAYEANVKRLAGAATVLRREIEKTMPTLTKSGSSFGGVQKSWVMPSGNTVVTDHDGAGTITAHSDRYTVSAKAPDPRNNHGFPERYAVIQDRQLGTSRVRTIEVAKKAYVEGNRPIFDTNYQLNRVDYRDAERERHSVVIDPANGSIVKNLDR